MISPTIFFNLVLGVIAALKVFTVAFVATQGGPAFATWFFALHIYSQAFKYLEMGYASALAWIFTLILLVLTVVQFRLSRRWVYYEGEECRVSAVPVELSEERIPAATLAERVGRQHSRRKRVAASRPHDRPCRCSRCSRSSGRSPARSRRRPSWCSSRRRCFRTRRSGATTPELWRVVPFGTWLLQLADPHHRRHVRRGGVGHAGRLLVRRASATPAATSSSSSRWRRSCCRSRSRSSRSTSSSSTSAGSTRSSR